MTLCTSLARCSPREGGRGLRRECSLAGVTPGLGHGVGGRCAEGRRAAGRAGAGRGEGAAAEGRGPGVELGGVSHPRT